MNNSYTYLSDPEMMKASDLIQLILQDHHAYVRAESGALIRMSAEAASESGTHYPELLEIDMVVKAIMADMDMHQMKEERILFPFIQAMDISIETGASLPQSCFGDVRNPIRAMENDHEMVHRLLAQLEALTNIFTAPTDANSLIIQLYNRLKAFRDNTFRHVHLENDILFKKATEMQLNF